MYVLKPIHVTAGMIQAGTSIAEPAAGETAWTSGGTYAVGDQHIRSTTHKVYECVQASTGRTALPENDPAYWLEKGPTKRHAPFDMYVSTAATAAGSMTYVLQPGYFTAVALYGLSAGEYEITVRDGPGGAVVYHRAGHTTADPAGWFEYLFDRQEIKRKLIFTNIPIRLGAELTITLTGASVSLGLLVIGDFVELANGAQWGGTLAGATAEPVSYSYIKTEDDGTTRIKRRNAATGMRATVMLPRRQADQALDLIQSLLDVPAAWVATTAPGFDGLSVFGLGSATVSYDSTVHATINLNVKGLI